MFSMFLPVTFSPRVHLCFFSILHVLGRRQHDASTGEKFGKWGEHAKPWDTFQDLLEECSEECEMHFC
jgi:hypothetical protein